jgi:maltose alpha-D-glucosyltransferase/alpha-amylase
MHMALASGEGEAFAAESFSRLYQRSLYQSLRGQARRGFAQLRQCVSDLPETVRQNAARVAAMEDVAMESLRRLLDHKISAVRTRCHGDYHLGQVLFTGNDFVIIDFEGEPQRPISERRIKTSPLRDVAGMIRSFHYAAHAAYQGETPAAAVQRQPGNGLQRWLRVWYAWTAAAFLRSYIAEAGSAGFLPASREELGILLDAYLLEKAIYELGYELNNRPQWIRIPLEGILQLLEPR